MANIAHSKIRAIYQIVHITSSTPHSAIIRHFQLVMMGAPSKPLTRFLVRGTPLKGCG